MAMPQSCTSLKPFKSLHNWEVQEGVGSPAFFTVMGLALAVECLEQQG